MKDITYRTCTCDHTSGQFDSECYVHGEPEALEGMVSQEELESLHQAQDETDIDRYVPESHTTA